MTQKLKAKVNSEKGFTLAELLVVVGIIAILVAIAIPVFSAATDRAEAAVMQANARSCKAEALITYISDPDHTGEYGAADSTGGGFTYTYYIDKAGNFHTGSVDGATKYEVKLDSKGGVTSIKADDITVNLGSEA